MKSTSPFQRVFFPSMVFAVCAWAGFSGPSQTLRANPSGGEVTAGSAEISASGSTLTITQGSDTAIINWQDFSISAGETTRFFQPSTTSATLNRVLGGNPSAIHGTLEANGQIYVINPNGVLVGAGGVIQTGGFLASTLDVSDESFLARGDLGFTGTSNASVVNLGTIGASEGDVILIARTVENHGEIRAPNGTAALAAGSEVLVKASGEERVFVEAGTSSGTSSATQAGLIEAAAAEIKAAGGNEYALAIKHSGVTRATGVSKRGGRIFLSAGGKGGISNSGTVRARKSGGGGGTVKMTAGGSVANDGTVDAAGTSGGNVEIAGGSVALGGLIISDGVDGGSVTVRSEGALSLADTISARGVEGSGGTIDLRAGGRVVENSGSRVDASGTTAGGTIHVSGSGVFGTSGTYSAASSEGMGGRIDLTADTLNLFSAKFDASGALGGGRVRLGGAFQGGKEKDPASPSGQITASFGGSDLPGLASASEVLVNDGVVIDVSSDHGTGGSAVVWSDTRTTFLGSVLAGGSAGSSNGGAVEISSADTLRHADLSGIADASILLLDPKNIVVGDTNSAQSWAYEGIVGFGYSEGKNVGLAGDLLEGTDYFGSSVSLNAAGDRLAVGAYLDDGFGDALTDSGAVYLFTFTNTSFAGGALSGTIGHGYSGGNNVDLSGTLDANDIFGYSVSLNAAGDRLAVGAYQDSGFGNVLTYAGAVYLFTFADTSFAGGALSGTIGHGYSGTNNVDLSAALNSSDQFGSGVSLNAAGDRLAVGAYFDNGFNNGLSRSGAVHLFSFTNTSFGGGTLTGTIGHGYTGGNNVNLSGILDSFDLFGISVSLNAAGDRLAVGAYQDYGFNNGLNSSGAVHLFSFADTSFAGGALSGTIGHGYSGGNNVDLSGTLDSFDNFGISVSLNAAGDRLAVGAYQDSGFGQALANAGAVYLFTFADTSFAGGALSGTIGHGYSGGNNINLSGTLGHTDQFGSSVSLNAAGDRLAVGAYFDDGFGNALSNSGAVHLFTFTNNSFAGGVLSGTIGHGYSGTKNVDLSATLNSSDQFGISVSLNAAGNRLAVGAYPDDGSGNTLSNSGAVYLFGFTDTNFSGGTLQSTIGHGYAGGKNLDLTGILGASDQFGNSVSLNAAGDRLAVGAYFDDGSGNSLSDSGAVYLFSFSDTTFSGGTLQARIGHGYTGSKNLDLTGILGATDHFGSSVSLNAAGDKLAVGAYLDDGSGNSLGNSGAVYLFGFTDTTFSGGTLEARIGHSYTGGKNLSLSGILGEDDFFGGSVSLNAAGDRLAVGAYLDDGSGNSLNNSGIVYLVSFSDTSFSGGTLQARIGHGYTGGKNINLSGILGIHDQFGSSVSLNAAGDRLAVGSYLDDGSDNSLTDSGAVYLYSFSDTTFTGGALEARIGHGYTGGKNLDLAGTLGTSDQFGVSVSLNAAGDRLVIGASQDDGFGNPLTNTGAVHLFTFTNTSFGGGTLTGTFGHGYSGGNNVNLSGILGAGDQFGSSVSLNAAGDRLAVGARVDDGFNNGLGDSGAVHLFTFTDTSFGGGTLTGTIGHGYTGGNNVNLSGILGSNDLFGQSVSLNAAGDRLAVGASNDNGFNNGLSASGAVYLFTFTDTSFGGGTLTGTIGHGYTGGNNVNLTGILGSNDQFGSSVSLNAAGDRLAVGAYQDDGFNNGLSNSGVVHLFTFTDTSFGGGTLTGTIGHGYTGGNNVDLSGILGSSDQFGSSVSLNAAGNRLAVGAFFDDGFNNGLNESGAVHLFSFTDTSFGGGG